MLVDRTTFPDIAHNYKHGNILRASGIFYYKKNKNFKTTISFLNYWKIKRDLTVTIISSLRNLDGSLIMREEIKFTNSDVINYIPNISEFDFEGSVEIEIFSLKDMVIPYAGIMVVYESKFGISMTHTYGRTYSSHEIEDGKTLLICEETCCHALLPKNQGKSYVIFHNGSTITPAQKITLSLLNYQDKRITTTISLKPLNPFQTIKLIPSEIFKNYYEFLNDKPGNVSISFSLNNSAFPRMLTVNETSNQDDFQVNHSNFNLSKNKAPRLEHGQCGYMNPVNLNDAKSEMVIYPDCEEGEYEAIVKNDVKVNFNQNHLVSIEMDSSTNNFIQFRKIDDDLPIRVHTGVRISKTDERLPSETCMGIKHARSEMKRFHWLIVAENKKFYSRIILRTFTDKLDHEKNKKNNPIILKLYSEKNNNVKEVLIDPNELLSGKRLKEIFPNAEDFLSDSFGWITIFSEYPHYDVYGTLENNHNSIAFEHSF